MLLKKAKEEFLAGEKYLAEAFCDRRSDASFQRKVLDMQLEGYKKFVSSLTIADVDNPERGNKIQEASDQIGEKLDKFRELVERYQEDQTLSNTSSDQIPESQIERNFREELQERREAEKKVKSHHEMDSMTGTERGDGSGAGKERKSEINQEEVENLLGNMKRKSEGPTSSDRKPPKKWGLRIEEEAERVLKKKGEGHSV